MSYDRRNFQFSEDVSSITIEKNLTDKTSIYDKKYIYFKIKRFSDIILSAIALFFISPLLLVLMIAIKLESPGPAIFKQKRVGKDGKEFVMYKLRSMRQDAEKKLSELIDLNKRDGPVFKIDNDPRVTKIGSFIRKTCLDEFPQLINILKGDMSIVGPRPALPSEVNQYSDYQLQRLSVTPGLSCYWQIQKDNNTTFDEWVELDLKYIREQSMFTDLKIIYKTIFIVLSVKGDA